MNDIGLSLISEPLILVLKRVESDIISDIGLYFLSISDIRHPVGDLLHFATFLYVYLYVLMNFRKLEHLYFNWLRVPSFFS
jgi:hypothetical protein